MAFGHKRGGTKVSGVKLKPVIPDSKSGDSSARSKDDSRKGKKKEIHSNPTEEEEDQDARSFMESIRKDRPPLTGSVICISGILEPVRSQTIAYAEKLGARVEKALTMEVTHLICDKPGSLKYNVALDHSIRIMLPLWLETLYSSFTEGEDIDLNEMTQRYTMKPFHNLKLAITGKASSSRTPFIKLAEDNGATVSIDLDVNCSHLVVLSVAPPNQTDPDIFEFEKVQAALKAEHPIKVVWQEWLEDSVQRLGFLPETPYLVKEGVPRPGRLYLTEPESANGDKDQRLGARTIQGDEFETAVPRKNMKSGSQNAIMASIIVQQDLPIRRHHSDLSTKPPYPQKFRYHFDEELSNNSPKQPDVSGPFVHHPLLKDSSKNTSPASIVQKLRSVKSKKFGSPTLSPNTSTATSFRTVPHLFRGLKISTAGCAATHQRTLADTVVRCGGQFTEVHSQADYTVVPLINPPFIPKNSNPVGHHWVEHSLFERKIINPDDHWSGRPVRLQPLLDPDQYVFSSCGHNRVEEHILQQTLKVMNLKYVEHPRRSVVTHFFVGPDKNSARLQTVKGWSEKELVDFDWLMQKCNGQRISPPDQRLSQSDTSKAIVKSIDFQSADNTSFDTHDMPLSECVIFMTRKGSQHHNSKHLADCRKLGARIVDKLIECVTHVVHAADRSSDFLRELKTVRARNIHIVHPTWLSECKSKRIKADEFTFPPTYKPERALSYCASPGNEITMADVSFNSIAEECDGVDDQFAQGQPEPILEQDETFYQSPSSPPVVPTHIRNLNSGDPISGPNHNSSTNNISKLIQSDDRPTSSHNAASPQSNAFRSSSPYCSGPGVDTQLGGFMEILQQRNQLNDFPLKTKEKDGRRGRKRLLDDNARSANNQIDESHQLIPIGHGLDRTLSNFSHSSTTASQVGGFDEGNSFEESMDVTWEDPAAKREILKAINDPIEKPSRRVHHRRQQNQNQRHELEADRQSKSNSSLLDPLSNDTPLNVNLGRTELVRGADEAKSNHLSKTRSERISEAENHPDLDGNNDEPEILIAPPLKRKRPRLISK